MARVVRITESVQGVMGRGASARALYPECKRSRLAAYHGRVPDSPPRAARPVWPAAVALVLALAYLAIGIARLSASHPHEDAYILFTYARNLAAGHGIVFHAGGPHSEGATDFLWMLGLSLGNALGLDVAVVAQAGNALGAGLLGFVLAGALGAGTWTPLARAAAACSAGVLATGAALAGWAGFASMLYAAVAVGLADLATRTGPRARAAVPVVALVLGLLRPDGVVLGTVLALGSYVLSASFEERRAWRRSALAALVLGGAYFAWRAWYFGELLPLPLVVKSNGLPALDAARLLREPAAVLPGLASSLDWLTSRAGPLPFLAVWLLAIRFAPERRRELRVAALLAAACAAVLLQLVLVRPTQNHAYRFQAPATLLAAYAAWRAAGGIALDAARSRAARSLALGGLAAMWVPGLTRIRDQWAWDVRARSYMDVLPARLAGLLPRERRIVLTEAGRLPFRVDAEIHDAVGLTESRTAHRPADSAYLTEIDPDLVFFHVANALEVPDDLGPVDSCVHELEPVELERFVAARWRDAYARDWSSYPPGIAPENMAALALARHVARGPIDYDVWSVRYQGGWKHVWAIRRSLPEREAIVAAIQACSEPSAWRSYADVGGPP